MNDSTDNHKNISQPKEFWYVTKHQTYLVEALSRNEACQIVQDNFEPEKIKHIRTSYNANLQRIIDHGLDEWEANPKIMMPETREQYYKDHPEEKP